MVYYAGLGKVIRFRWTHTGNRDEGPLLARMGPRGRFNTAPSSSQSTCGRVQFSMGRFDGIERQPATTFLRGNDMPAHATYTMLPSNTQSAAVDAGPSELFDFLADPRNLPRWAVGFCRAIRSDGDRWVATTPQGEVSIRYVTNRDSGTIDFHISPAPAVEFTAFSRVLPNGDGAEYVFTQYQLPGMSADLFAGQIAALAEELHVVQSIMRARAACGAADQGGEGRDE